MGQIYMRNPLDSTWIRAKVTQYVSLKDALACALVCKDWTDDFNRSIWHTIDFDIHKEFANLDKEVISKNGHRIRVIKNVKNRSQLDIIQNPSICVLKSLSVSVGTSSITHSQCHEILRRNNTTLTFIDLFLLGFQGDEPGLLFSVESISPAACLDTKSKLSSFKLKGITISRNALSSLLRLSPLLNTLDIRYSLVTTTPESEIYQHPTLSCLVSPIKQVFKPDPEFPNAPSLFAHFPNLEEWKTWVAHSSQPDVSIETIKAETTRYCPLLKTIFTELISNYTVQLLVSGFEKLKGVCILHKHMSTEVIMAILSHHETLECVMTYTLFHKFYEYEGVLPVDAHFQTHGWVVQTLLRLCPRLTTFEFPLYEMDMDDIEKGEWICDGLEELHIRIRGLDTKDAISRALQLWVDWREMGKVSPSLANVLVCNREKHSLEERVARHLLKFKKLDSVWLGYGIRKVKCL
ncbi:hypothetical protein BGZ76_007148 [Entomortierella beljakovae]|nr:hypothetical protein BGZ76_007148 [Entomortierella beljakovae]